MIDSIYDKTKNVKMKSPFLVGEKIYLRPTTKEDLVHIQECLNDSETRKLIGEVTPMNELGLEEYYERICKDENRIWFSIVLKEDNKVIGETGLLRMFHFWRNTDLSIIIGEKDGRGKGYGTEAILLLLDYAFGYLNFHRVSIGVVGFNNKALKFYEKIGFKREGIQRDGYYYDYKYYDFVMMSILEDEFKALYTRSTHRFV